MDAIAIPERLGRARLSVVQGAFYLGAGLWPLVHLRSFEAVTGPKREGWLVKTVGTLIAVVGGVLLYAGLRRRVDSELAAVAAGSALGLGAIDVIYASKRRISPVYLLDAGAEACLIAAWAFDEARARRVATGPGALAPPQEPFPP